MRKGTRVNYTWWISDRVYPKSTEMKIFVFVKTLCWFEMCNAECGSVNSDSEQQNMPAMLLYNFEIDFILNLKWFCLLSSFVYFILAKYVFFTWHVWYILIPIINCIHFLCSFHSMMSVYQVNSFSLYEGKGLSPTNGNSTRKGES